MPKKPYRPMPGTMIELLWRKLQREPDASPDQLFKGLKRKGFKPASQHSVQQMVYLLAQRGLTSKGRRRRGDVKLGSKKAKAMRAIWENRHRPTSEIARLPKIRNARISRDYLYATRMEMRKAGMNVGKHIYPGKKLELTSAQKKLLPQVPKLIGYAISEGLALVNWPASAIREFMEFVNLEKARIARDYDPKRGKLSTYVITACLPRLVSRYMERDLRQKLDLGQKDVRLLLYALGQRKAGKTVKEIAVEKRVKATELRELLQLYDSYKASIGWDQYEELSGQRRSEER